MYTEPSFLVSYFTMTLKSVKMIVLPAIDEIHVNKKPTTLDHKYVYIRG